MKRKPIKLSQKLLRELKALNDTMYSLRHRAGPAIYPYLSKRIADHQTRGLTPTPDDVAYWASAYFYDSEALEEWDSRIYKYVREKFGNQLGYAEWLQGMFDEAVRKRFEKIDDFLSDL
jgi:hypothetical protein